METAFSASTFQSLYLTLSHGCSGAFGTSSVLPARHVAGPPTCDCDSILIGISSSLSPPKTNRRDALCFAALLFRTLILHQASISEHVLAQTEGWPITSWQRLVRQCCIAKPLESLWYRSWYIRCWLSSNRKTHWPDFNRRCPIKRLRC